LAEAKPCVTRTNPAEQLQRQGVERDELEDESAHVACGAERVCELAGERGVLEEVQLRVEQVSLEQFFW